MTLTAATVASQVPTPASAVPPAPVVIDDSAVPDPMESQLTDPVAPATFTATGESSSSLTASATGLPAGLTVSARSIISATEASWTISGTPTAGAGAYTGHVVVTDSTQSDSFDVDVSVDPEDATVVYSAPTEVVGNDPDGLEIPFTMTAQVTQAQDNNLGDISSATVTFTDTNTGHVLCAAAPVTTAGAGPGTASCQVVADVFDEDEVTYEVDLAVGGAYLGASADDTEVTVSLPEEPDTDAPETKITAGPANWLLDPSATFKYSSSAPDSDFICRLDAAKVNCNDSAVTLNGLTSRTHRFTVLAEDEYGERDETPAVRDFAVPVDDATLKATGSWKRVHSGAAYEGTFAQAKTKGVALSYKVSNVRELALLVRTGSKFGSVKVYLDGALLGLVKTQGPAGQKMVNLAHFAQAKSGTVKIVTTTGRTVRIDGLGVSTVAF
jgi:hypothetical protein